MTLDHFLEEKTANFWELRELRLDEAGEADHVLGRHRGPHPVHQLGQQLGRRAGVRPGQCLGGLEQGDDPLRHDGAKEVVL